MYVLIDATYGALLIHTLLLSTQVCSQVISYNCLDEVCPLENTELTCHTMENGMRWYAPPGNQLGTIFALVPSSHTFKQSGYTGTFINYTSVSGMWTMLSFTATTDKNGTQVRCVDVINSSSTTCTILISGPPSDAPTGLGFTALTNTSVTLYWSPPTLHPNCIVNYTVEIRTTSDNILISSLSTGNNITSINVSTGLSQSVEYQYIVVGSDIINRLGPYSQYTVFTLDVLQAVPVITYTITNNIKDYTIFIFWESPPLSSHPTLLYYKVYHNISGSLTVNITTVTNITLTGVLAGYTYIITVVPVNILGDGYPNKTIVIIPNKEPVTTSVVTTSFKEIITTSVSLNITPCSLMSFSTPATITSFSNTALNSLITPIMAVTTHVCPTNERQQPSCLAVAVSIPVSMFLSSVLTAVITTLIVYLIMRRRSNNKDTPPTTTTQLGLIYDDVKLPETSEQKEIIELQGNTAYGYIN